MTIPAHVESTPLVYTINGEDRTAFVQFNPRPSFESTVTNALDKFQFTWYDPDQTLVPGVWQDVSITMDGTAIFGGKNALSKVSESFFTIDSNQRKLQMGLSVIKEILGQHHGEILELPSSKGKGATFIIKLPVATKDNES